MTPTKKTSPKSQHRKVPDTPRSIGRRNEGRPASNSDLPDTMEVADKIHEQFELTERAQVKLEVCLPYLRPERFAIPYDDGVELAVERMFGLELRVLMSQPTIPAPLFALYSEHTFELAAMLEFLDRHGFKRMYKLLRSAAENDDIPIRTSEPRKGPVRPEHALPMLRESLACIFEDLTGQQPSLADFDRSRMPRSGSPADFILTTLKLLGWKYSVRDIRKNYSNVVDVEHRW